MAIRDVKKDYIIDTAQRLFLSRSVSDVTVRDIAQTADVGEATVYRYFEKKQNIVLGVAKKLSAEVYAEHFSPPGGKTGYKKLKRFYNGYLSVYTEHPEFCRFLREFDMLLLSGDDMPLGEYERELDVYRDFYMKAYREGIADGSVAEQADIGLFYYATTHALLELCKKFGGEKDLLPQDTKSDKAGEIATLIGLVLNALKKTRA